MKFLKRYLFILCGVFLLFGNTARVQAKEVLLGELSRTDDELFQVLPEKGQELFYDRALRNDFLSLCEEYEFDPAVMLAIMFKESSFNPDADNGLCKGLMQIYPKWHKERMEELQVTDLTDPLQNMITGMDYLAELKTDDRSMEYALMIYNMGYKKATASLKEYGYSEYATSIMEYAKELRYGGMESET